MHFSPGIIKAFSQFASADAAQGQLHFGWLKLRKHFTTLEATDGYSAIRIKLDHPESGSESANRLIERHHLEQIKYGESLLDLPYRTERDTLYEYRNLLTINQAFDSINEMINQIRDQSASVKPKKDLTCSLQFNPIDLQRISCMSQVVSDMWDCQTFVTFTVNPIADSIKQMALFEIKLAQRDLPMSIVGIVVLI